MTIGGGALKPAQIDPFTAGYAVSGHHLPEHFGSLIAVPMMAVVLWRSLRSRG